MAYGFIHHEAGVQAARMAVQILRDAAPGNLPLEDAESFLALNLQTAAEIGLPIPDAYIQQAMLVIRADAK